MLKACLKSWLIYAYIKSAYSRGEFLQIDTKGVKQILQMVFEVPLKRDIVIVPLAQVFMSGI